MPRIETFHVNSGGWIVPAAFMNARYFAWNVTCAATPHPKSMVQ